MGFWNKFGKIALTVAPYVAAPFTGGASLAFTGLANKGVQAWNQHDAQKAYEKGVAPSSFDKYLGMAGDIAGMAGGAGAFGKMGSNFGASSFAPKNFTQSAMMNAGNAVMDRYANGGQSGGGYSGGGYGTPAFNSGPSGNMGGYGGSGGGAVPRGTGGVMPRGGFSYNQNPMNQYDQSSPNLATSIFQGRQEAIRNQPFRGGYNVQYGTPEEPDVRGIGPIYPNFQPKAQGRFDSRGAGRKKQSAEAVQ